MEVYVHMYIVLQCIVYVLCRCSSSMYAYLYLYAYCLDTGAGTWDGGQKCVSRQLSTWAKPSVK